MAGYAGLHCTVGCLRTDYFGKLASLHLSNDQEDQMLLPRTGINYSFSGIWLIPMWSTSESWPGLRSSSGSPTELRRVIVWRSLARLTKREWGKRWGNTAWETSKCAWFKFRRFPPAPLQCHFRIDVLDKEFTSEQVSAEVIGPSGPIYFDLDLTRDGGKGFFQTAEVG